MQIKKEVKYILIIIFALLACLGCLYYYFFVKLEGDWMFWKGEGEDIEWSNVEYEDFVLDTEVETFGEYGEWKMKEMNPVYAGYDTTEDGINYIIGKYLDEEGKEQTVKILVSGEGVVDYPYPDTDFKYFYNNVYKDYAAVKPSLVLDNSEEVEKVSYTPEESFVEVNEYELEMYPSEYVITRAELTELLSENGTEEEGREYTDEEVEGSGLEVVDEEEADEFLEENTSELVAPYYIGEEYFQEYYDPFYFYEMLISTEWDMFLEDLSVGDQISVVYLVSDKSFEDCKYVSDGLYKLLCSNQYLNEMYEDFIVSVYIEI